MKLPNRDGLYEHCCLECGDLFYSATERNYSDRYCSVACERKDQWDDHIDMPDEPETEEEEDL